MSGASIFDVTKYILDKQGDITVMKLQKLTFYAKAWGLVWDEEELFPEKYEAWANGAVSPVLYKKHKGCFKVTSDLFGDADPCNIPEHHKETIDKVLEFYGEYTAQQLSDINHQELPWIDAREGFLPEERCNSEITTAAIAEYYSGVWNAEGGE